ncbi:MAG TPA: hypothetical protein VMY37_10795 [Thermoguttaceae bacterium]|nr:hypothetical protein [Thermoguttaceae bacterium]
MAPPFRKRAPVSSPSDDVTVSLSAPHPMPVPPPGLLATGPRIGYHGIYQRDDLSDEVEQLSFTARTGGLIWPI